MFAPYSWSCTRIRCPSFIGTDQNAAFHAAVAFSKRAISCGRAWIRRAIDPFTASRSPARSAATSYPPVVASLCRYSSCVSTTTCGGNDAPAWLRWT